MSSDFADFVEIWPPCWCGDAEVGTGVEMGAGITSLLWPATQFYIINRSALGKHLGESIKEIKAIINSSLFSIDYKLDALTTLHISYTSIIITLENRR